MVDKQQPLHGSYNEIPQEEPFYYVLHFLNPYDEQLDSLGKLGKSIDKSNATELFHSAFKALDVHTLSVTRFLSKLETEHQDPNVILEELNTFLQNQPGDTIDTKLFLEFVLKSLLVILQRNLKFKVEMFRSRDNDEIFIKLWLSDANLKIHADLIDYKLQLKLVASPSEESQDHTQIAPFASYAMYRPIPKPRDFSNSHHPGQYDEIFLDSKFKQYDSNDQEYDSTTAMDQNNLSIFSYKDKVRLIRDILSNAVDLEFLVDNSLLLAHYSIHKEIQLQELKSELLHPRFWKKTDIDKVRMYFGEQIALFYAWLEFYSFCMLIPAGLGLIVFIVLEFTPNAKEYISAGEYSIIIYTILICFSASVVGRFWTRYENTLTFRWGMHNNSIDPEQRPYFIGDYKVDTFTDKARKFYSEPTKVSLKRLVNWIIVVLFIGLDVLIIWGFFRAVGSVKEANGNSYILGTLIGIQIQVMIFLFSQVAKWLNNLEMYETQAQYEDALVLKLFLFQFVNSYGSLLYIAFVRPHIEGCSQEGCIQELSNALLMVLVMIFVLSILEMFAPFIRQKLTIWLEKRKVKRMLAQGIHIESQPIRVEMSAVEEQGKLATYKSTSDVQYIRNYMDVVTIYGYVVLFSSAFSLLPIIALVVNVMVIKVNSWRLCILCKRPYPEMAKSIGIWSYIMNTLSLLGAFSNAGIMLLTYDIFADDNQTWQIKCATFLSLEVLIILFKFIIESAWGKKPSSVKQGMIWCDIYARENLNLRSASLQLRRYQWTLYPIENDNYSEIPFHIRHILDDNPLLSRR